MKLPQDNFSLRHTEFFASSPEGAMDETAAAESSVQLALPFANDSVTARSEAANLLRGASMATVAAAAFLSVDAEAQTTAPAPAPSDTTTMDELVVQGQQNSPYAPRTASSPLFTEPLRDVPQSVTVVPQAVIQERNSTTLRDVLRNVPGISMTSGEGGSGPGGDNLSIRGFNARNDVFIDNVRDFGAYSRDPFNYEQVEVIKGPSSTYTGRGSTGGSINLVTKTAKLESSFYHADLGIGTEDYKRFTIDVNQRLTGLWKNKGATGDAGSPDGKIVAPTEPVDKDPYFKASFRLNAMWTEGEVANRDYVDYKRWGIAPSLVFGFGDNTKLTLNYFHMQEDNQPDYGIPFVTATQSYLPRKYWNKLAPVSYSTYYGSTTRDFEKTTTDIGTILFEQTVGEWFKLNNTIRYGQTHRDSITTAPRFINGVTDPNVLINQEFQPRDQIDTIIAEQLDTRFSFSTFGVKHELVTGFDLSYETNKNSLRVQTPTVLPTRLNHPDATRDYTASWAYSGARNESNETNAGLFAFDTLKFWDDKIQLSGGARWDYYESELNQRLVTGVTNVFERTDKIWSWRIALAYKPVKNGTFYVAYGTSFNPSGESAVSLTPVTAATNALEPEKNRTWEAGTKWDFFNERLSLTGAVFRTDKTNARTPGLSPTDPVTVLEGEQRVQGFEVGISGNITDHWKVFGGYTYLESEIRKSNTFTTVPGTTRLVSQVGNELPQTPKNTFSLWTTYELPWQIEIGAGVNYVDDRFAGTDNLRVAPDYWTCDAMISKQFTKNLKAQINVFNLTDEEYIDRVSGGHAVPGTGRTAMLTVGLAF